MKFSKVFLKSFFLLPACIVTSCSNSNTTKIKNKPLQEITVNIETEPGTLDSRKACLLTDYNLIKTLNEGLFRINKKGVTSHAIADRYLVKNDNKTYEIFLKKTTWSNGDPLTAHDFIYAWRSLLEKNFPSPNTSFLFPIENARQIKKGELPADSLGAYAENDYKIIIKLETPMPFLIELLSLPIYFPINKTVAKEHIDPAITPDKYISNGPFTLTSWKHKNKIVVSKNKNYWDTTNVKLQKITMIMVSENTAYNLFINKELHHIGSPFTNIPLDALPTLVKNDAVHKNSFLGTYWIRINTQKYPLNNKYFRKSLASSIDRKAISDHLFCGCIDAATSIVPNAMCLQEAPFFNDGDTKESLEYFNTAMEQLITSKKDLPKLTLIYMSSDLNNRITCAMQDGWRSSLGISVQLEPLEGKVYMDRLSKGDYELAYSGWTAHFKDPINFLDVFKTKYLETNNTFWENLEYKNILKSSYECNNTADRKKLLIKAEKILMGDMPVIPVHHFSMLHLQDELLKDLVIIETGAIDFKWAYLEIKPEDI